MISERTSSGLTNSGKNTPQILELVFNGWTRKIETRTVASIRWILGDVEPLSSVARVNFLNNLHGFACDPENLEMIKKAHGLDKSH